MRWNGNHLSGKKRSFERFVRAGRSGLPVLFMSLPHLLDTATLALFGFMLIIIGQTFTEEYGVVVDLISVKQEDWELAQRIVDPARSKADNKFHLESLTFNSDLKTELLVLGVMGKTEVYKRWDS